MAAAIPFASPLLEEGQRQVRALVDDPVRWVVKALRIAGSALLLTGILLGSAAYYMKAGATAAMNNEKQILGNISNIFSNIKAPTFHPAATGTSPLTPNLAGVQNFFSDAWKDVSAAGSDLAGIGGVIGTLGEDVALGLTDIGKAILAFVMHTPDLLWNGLVWGVGGSIADVLSWVFPYLVIFGAVMLAASFALSGAWWAWERTAKPAFERASARWGARQEAKAEAFFDRLFRNHARPVAPVGPDAAEREAPEGAEAVPITVPEPPEAPDTETSAPEGGVNVQAEPALGLPPTREELETELGDGYTEAKDRMRAQLRARDSSPASASA